MAAAAALAAGKAPREAWGSARTMAWLRRLVRSRVGRLVRRRRREGEALLGVSRAPWRRHDADGAVEDAPPHQFELAVEHLPPHLAAVSQHVLDGGGHRGLAIRLGVADGVVLDRMRCLERLAGTPLRRQRFLLAAVRVTLGRRGGWHAFAAKLARAGWDAASIAALLDRPADTVRAALRRLASRPADARGAD
jgi:DNA-directed RNA polymerase specialized sigma24 family protein